MNKADFSRGMLIISSAIQREIPESTMKTWFEILGDLTFDQFKVGILKTLNSNTFAGLPPIGLIRQNATGNVGQIDTEDRALLAWGKVFAAIGKHGGYRTVTFDDPLIMATIREICGSWADLCGQETDQLGWTKKEFLKVYGAHMNLGTVSSTAVAPLPGILAQDASLKGLEPPKPIRIVTNLPPSKVKTVEESTSTKRGIVERIGHDVALQSIRSPLEDDEPVGYKREQQRQQIANAKAALMEKHG
jgi:hypothetical protein